MCASCLEGHGRTRTAKLREPSFWNEKSWSRLDRQFGLCELLYRAGRHDAIYGVETRHHWYYEDGWYVKLSVTMVSYHRAQTPDLLPPYHVPTSWLAISR